MLHFKKRLIFVNTRLTNISYSTYVSFFVARISGLYHDNTYTTIYLPYNNTTGNKSYYLYPRSKRA